MIETMNTTTEFAPGLVIRGITPPLKLSDFKLIAFDMDSTLINIECVDEIADAVGCKAEVAAITEAAATTVGSVKNWPDRLLRAAVIGRLSPDLKSIRAQKKSL